MAEAYGTGGSSDIDFTSLAGLSQEDVNKRILAAMLQQGSSRYDQAMLADTLQRSRGPVPLGPRGRGRVGEMNDFVTAFRPGMERAQAQEMVKQLREKDMRTMQAILGGGGQAQPGAVPNANIMGAGGGAPSVMPMPPVSNMGLNPTGRTQQGLTLPQDTPLTPRVPNPEDPYNLFGS